MNMHGIPVTILGLGNIGEPVVEGFHRMANRLRHKGRELPLRALVSSTTYYVCNPLRGIGIKEVATILKARRSGDTHPDALPLVDDYQELFGNTPGIVVDCTKDPTLTPVLLEALQRGHRLVLARKAPLSNPDDFYALTQGGRTGYSATVGAGQVIPKIHRMRAVGDDPTLIVASLSGTLNTFCSTPGPKSEVIRKAQKDGITEPDPADDLLAGDVAEKIAILANAAGFHCAAMLDRIHVEELCNPDWRGLELEDFLGRFASMDPYYEERFSAAETKGRVLRYIVSISETHASAQLRELDPADPFAKLTGAENLFHIISQHHPEQHPNIISALGAGAQQTADAVLADIADQAEKMC